MRTLLAYTATPKVMPDLRRTLAVQREYYPKAWAAYDKVVVGGWMDDLPCAVVDCGEGDDFCISKARNAAIGFARREGYDWVVLLDADHVVLNPMELAPRSGFGAPMTAWQWEHEGFPLDLSAAERWMESQWWILGREHFGRQFCEQFVGYGFEEVDFQRHVMADVPVTETDLRVVHLWHPRRAARWADVQLFEQRKREYEEKRSGNTEKV